MKFKSSVFSTAFLFASSIALAAASLSTSGCTDTEDGVLPEEGEVALLSSDPDATKADRISINFTKFTLTANSQLPRPNGEVRKIFTTLGSYRNYFGAAPPSDVNFGAGDWVGFYDAGSKPTGGYTATILDLRRSDSGLILKMVTRLTSPGEGCRVTLALTRPYVLVRFRAPTVPRIEYVQFLKDNENAPSCVPASPCDAVRCAAGTHCEEQQIVCITTPCNPIAQCVPDSVACASSNSCGAGQYCTTEDGVCNSNCAPGMLCPAVCYGTCAPRPVATCAATLCAAGTICEDTPSGAVCKPIPTGTACTSSSSCATGQYCTTEDGVCNSNCAPGRICPAVCWGTCKVKPATVTCASLRCAQGYQCTDHPGANATCDRVPGGCTQDSDCQLYDQYCPSNPCACEVLGWNQRPATCSASSQVQCFVQPCRAKRAACSAGRCTVVAQ